MSKLKTYTIGKTTYELVKPVFAILRQVALFCRAAGEEVKNETDLIEALDDKAAPFVALLITPKGVHPKDRDLDAIATAVDWEVEDPNVPATVVADFFDHPEVTPDNMVAAGSVTKMVVTMVKPLQLTKASLKAGRKPSKQSSGT